MAYVVWEVTRDIEPDRVRRAAALGIDAAQVKAQELRFGFRSDLMLNKQWTPRGMTALLIA